jgi:hypothetical protein
LTLSKGINICSNAAYHADREYLSSSKLKTILESVEKFKTELDNPSPAATGAHLDLGTYVHSLLLEPELVATEYAVFPGFRRAGKDFEIFKAQNSGKNIISLSMQNTGQRLAASTKACPAALDLLKGGQAELSIADEVYGVKCKARFDYINVDRSFLLDVKTSRDSAGKEYFKDTIKQYKYDLSAALYLQIAEQYYGKKFDFYWLVISKSEIETRVYKASERTLKQGHDMVKQALEKYRLCVETGIWLDTVAEKKEKEIQNEIEEI